MIYTVEIQPAAFSDIELAYRWICDHLTAELATRWYYDLQDAVTKASRPSIIPVMKHRSAQRSARHNISIRNRRLN